MTAEMMLKGAKPKTEDASSSDSKTRQEGPQLRRPATGVKTA